MSVKPWLFCSALLVLTASPVLAVAVENLALSQPAVMTRQAQHAVLLDVARAGGRLVAVGERGIVLLSDDNGQQWRQATVPVSVSLTAVHFVDENNGWAVGHAGVVLNSHDGGEQWSLQLDGERAARTVLREAEESNVSGDQLAQVQRMAKEGADKPLLALHFSDALHGWVVGAYGLALYTEDGGVTWHSFMGRLPNPGGLHLYAIAVSGSNFNLAGEQGLFLRSQDHGQSFEAIDTTYEGSYFTLDVLTSGTILLGGLRGTVMRSENLGSSFAAIDNQSSASLSTIRPFTNSVVALDQSGELLAVGSDGRTLRSLGRPAGQGLTAMIEAADGSLIGVGVSGAVRLPNPFLPASE